MKSFRTTVSLLIALFILGMASAALAAASWATDPATGGKIGYVHDDYTLTAATWSGPLVDGKADGKGAITLTVRGNKDGSTTTGKGEAEMKAGLIHGRAVLTWSDGNYADCLYADGQRISGLYKGANGGVYEGEFKNNFFHGKGTYKYPDGFKYEGDWVNGSPHGRGVGTNPAGQVVHDGEWKNGQPYTPAKTDNVLGVPWGATFEQAKTILLKRPNTTRVSFLDGKDGDNRWYYFGGPFADFADAWIYVHFYQDKMWQVQISWPLKDDQVHDRFATIKQGLTGRYGPPSEEKGKYLDSIAVWNLGDGYFVNVQIRQNTFKIAAADPTPQTHPFRVIITYHDQKIVDIREKNAKPGTAGGGSKDY